MAPPGAHPFDDDRDHRWRITAPYITGRGKSKSWGVRTDKSDFEAMVFVSQYAWSRFEARGGHAADWEPEGLGEAAS